MDEKFKLVSKFKPTGDQPQAIEKLVKGINSGMKHQTLLGVTGSGKTFSTSCLINSVQKPTLVLAHNKTLAAQLAAEYKEFFPNNSVQYFVSYYDYYQPEAYIPRTDTFIEKETEINEEIEKYRNAATQALLTRRDVIIVASVSCIYGLGDPEDYFALSRKIEAGKSYQRHKLLRHLTDLQYQRNDLDFHRGTYRVKGDTIDIFPAYDDEAIRIEYYGDDVEKIVKIDPLTGDIVQTFNEVIIFPAKHYVTTQEKLMAAMGGIRSELNERIDVLKKSGKLVEAQRLEQRTNYDLEMIEHTGFCSGIENYSRHVEGRPAGSAPSTLLDYFPDDYLMVIDESHISIPQVRGMYGGDRSRKQTLVDFGFRLPSAMDNRPLRFEEFSQRLNQVIYTSATPTEYELSLSREQGQIAEQIIRPTGLLDPTIEIRPIQNQIDNIIGEITLTIRKGQRILVTTLTKRMAEDLTDYLLSLGIKVQYIHSDVETIERTEILRDLRLGVYDVIVGINLLREGLDLPEVSLVAILDADKEGFLRSTSALIQTMGRAARHQDGHVIMYADRITQSMENAIGECNRRRKIQQDYNVKHNITPTSINKEIRDSLKAKADETERAKLDYKKISKIDFRKIIKNLEEQMDEFANNLQFEKAAEIRDEIKELKLNQI